MPISIPVTFEPPVFPEGFCPELQEFATQFTALLRGYVNGQFQGVIVSETEPAPEFRDRVWFKLNGPNTGWFVYLNGAWVRPYPIEPNSGLILEWEGTLAELKLFGGGEDAPVTATTGPFWEEAPEYRGKLTVGVGDLSPSGRSLSLGQELGADKVTLVESELPRITPTVDANGRGNAMAAVPGSGSRTGIVFQQTPSGDPFGTLDVSEIGGDEPHENMPPVKALYKIRRTARIYIRA
jgi:hypothetical protein